MENYEKRETSGELFLSSGWCELIIKDGIIARDNQTIKSLEVINYQSAILFTRQAFINLSEAPKEKPHKWFMDQVITALSLGNPDGNLWARSLDFNLRLKALELKD